MKKKAARNDSVQHVKLQPLIGQQFYCPLCMFQSDDNSKVHAHMREKHAPTPPKEGPYR